MIGIPRTAPRSMIPIDFRGRCDRNYSSFTRRLRIRAPDAAYMNFCVAGRRGQSRKKSNLGVIHGKGHQFFFNEKRKEQEYRIKAKKLLNSFVQHNDRRNAI